MSTNAAKFWKWVNEIRKERGLSFRAIERAGGLSNGAVSKREADGLPPTLDTIRAIAAAFRLKQEVVFRKTLSSESEIDDALETLLYSYGQLGIEHRRVVTDIACMLSERRAEYKVDSRENEGNDTKAKT